MIFTSNFLNTRKRKFVQFVYTFPWWNDKNDNAKHSLGFSPASFIEFVFLLVVVVLMKIGFLFQCRRAINHIALFSSISAFSFKNGKKRVMKNDTRCNTVSHDKIDMVYWIRLGLVQKKCTRNIPNLSTNCFPRATNRFFCFPC